jgi:hypothetical protein
MRAPFLSPKPQHPPLEADLSTRLPKQRLTYAQEGLALPTPAAEGLLRVPLVAQETLALETCPLADSEKKHWP